MALKQCEAIVLRSYPLRESDLLVTLFTRSEGKLRGVAKAAAGPWEEPGYARIQTDLCGFPR